MTQQTDTRTANNKIAGALMVIIALINLAILISPLLAGGTQIFAGEVNENNLEGPVAVQEATQDVAGMQTPMGIATFAASVLLLITGIPVLMNKRWEIFAMMVLGADSTLKFVNGIVQMVVGQNILDAFLVPIIFIIVEAAAIFLLFRAWNSRKQVYPTQ
jgi:hypothetical protein